MNEINFSECVENRIARIREVLSSKEEEYATEGNRFHNFDVAARILDCTPEQALQGMMLKHIVSVLDLIQWAEEEEHLITAAVIDEKIGDTINYLILLEGLLLRRLEKKNKCGVCSPYLCALVPSLGAVESNDTFV